MICFIIKTNSSPTKTKFLEILIYFIMLVANQNNYHVIWRYLYIFPKINELDKLIH